MFCGKINVLKSTSIVCGDCKVSVIGSRKTCLGNSKAREIYCGLCSIHKRYDSPYEFRVEKAGEHTSRANLNYILNGKTDIKITTVRILAKLLAVKTRDLLDFIDFD